MIGIMRRKRILEDRILRRISRKKSAVFLREDFGDMAGYDQVGRALRNLTKKGALMNVGYGLYVKASISPFNGEIVPVKNLPSLAKEALGRLGVQTLPSFYEREYNAGRSTQVPTGRRIGVTTRISRRIGYNGSYISYERIPQ